MVNSKKMSKSSVAVIVLSILLVLSMLLGLTGAWFTRSAEDKTDGVGNLVMGSLGNVTITAEGVKWTQGITDESRDKVMPGDTVTCGSLKIVYDAASAGTEDKVFYIINDGSENYVINAEGNLEVATAAGEIAQGEAGLSVEADYATTASGALIDGDGEKITAADDEGKAVKLAVGFSNNEVTYTVKVIQGANLTAATAFAELTA